MQDTKNGSAEIFALLEQFLGQFDGGVTIIDPLNKNKIIEINDMFLTITGYSRNELLGKDFSLFLEPLNQQQSNDLSSFFESKQSFRTTCYHYRKNGGAFWHDIFGMPIHDLQGILQYYVLFTYDKTHEMNVNALVELERQVYTSLEQGTNPIEVFEQIANHISNTFQKGCECSFIFFNNPHLLEEMPGNMPIAIKEKFYPMEAKLDITNDVLSKRRRNSIIVNNFADEPFWTQHLDSIKEQGYEAFWSEMIFGQDGEILGRYCMYFKEKIHLHFSDLKYLNQVSSIISLTLKYHEQREEIYKLAYYDTSTGLRNNLSFKMELKRQQKHVKQGFILIAQPSEYQNIVDVYGRDCGDDLLRQLATRFKSQFVSHFTLFARYTSSSIIMAAHGQVNSVAEISEMVQAIVNEPFIIHGKQLFITLKVGKSTYEPGISVDEMIQQADTSLSFAFKEVGNMVKTFDPLFYSILEKEMEVHGYLNTALKNHEFRPVLQPKVDIKTGEIVGFEALARWNSAVLGFVSPAIFIPVAEKTGNIADIDVQIFEQVLTWQKDRLHQGKKLYPVSVNISPSHFYNPTFVENMVSLLQAYKVSAEFICFEITESIELGNIDRAKDIIQKLKEHGIATSMDDFGIGYSSLSYLQQLAFKEIKIDKSFIDHIEEKRMNAVVKSIVQLAEAVEMTSVAEGIETKEQHEKLLASGCQIGQGYYYYKPMPLDEIDRLIAEPTYR